jgi:two-component system response regulator MprA
MRITTVYGGYNSVLSMDGGKSIITLMPELSKTNAPPVVLVVDNDERVAVILRTYLEPRGYQVEVCSDSSDVPGRISATAAQLVLLDVLMPGTGGLEACRRIRAGGLRLPVVMLSSQGTPKDVERARAAGADDYVTKPVDLKILEASLSRLLHGRRK